MTRFSIPARPATADDSRSAARRRHADALLDLALEQSFPASDPPAIIMPHPRKALS